MRVSEEKLTLEKFCLSVYVRSKFIGRFFQTLNFFIRPLLELCGRTFGQLTALSGEVRQYACNIQNLIENKIYVHRVIIFRVETCESWWWELLEAAKPLWGSELPLLLGKRTIWTLHMHFLKGQQSEIMINDFPAQSPDSVFISKQFCSETRQLNLGCNKQMVQ